MDSFRRNPPLALLRCKYGMSRLHEHMTDFLALQNRRKLARRHHNRGICCSRVSYHRNHQSTKMDFLAIRTDFSHNCPPCQCLGHIRHTRSSRCRVYRFTWNKRARLAWKKDRHVLRYALWIHPQHKKCRETRKTRQLSQSGHCPHSGRLF